MLTRLAINNYKSIKSEDILLSPLTIFSGYNGLGKSSVLQSLLLLRQSFRNNNFQNGLFLRSDELVELGVGKDIFSYDADYAEGISFVLESEFENSYALNFKVQLEDDVMPLHKATAIPPAYNWSEVSLFNHHFQYLSANRIDPQNQYKTSSYYIDQLQSLGKTGEYTVHYLAKNQYKIISNNTLKHPSAKSDTLMDNVNAWLSEISPGVKAIASLHPDLEVASLKYQFEAGGDLTDTFKPIHVGFGLTYVLPVITALLMSEPGDLFVVENPESNLHPAGQAKIGHLCALAANSGVQIIMETHSDHVINGIRVAVKQQKIENNDVSLYFIDRNIQQLSHQSNIVELFIDEQGRIDEWPKGFMDEWEKQLDQLLKS
jgi:predicted ATPase